MTILFTFAVAYTWLAYLRDWERYYNNKAAILLRRWDAVFMHIMEKIAVGEVPSVSIDPGWAEDEQLVDLIESIEEYARLLGGSVKVKIVR